MKARNPKIEKLECIAYRIPTDAPEGDGTLEWNSTTMIVVFLEAAGINGVGYSYVDAAAAALIETFKDHIVGGDALNIADVVGKLNAQVRNSGRSGIAACAISAIDLALWDLKARFFEVPLCQLLGRSRNEAEIYGSGGFTTYSDAQLTEQLAGWVGRDGCQAVKMKVGARPSRDRKRVATARKAIGEVNLFVDANGAFMPGSAIRYISGLSDFGISWFEEPVTSDDATGLSLVRMKSPSGVEIAAGEYIFNLDNAQRLLAAGAVDVLQADATRCGGVSGFMKVAALCEAYHLDLSGHCAPSAHLHLACAAARLRHLEWFHDHVRIEHMLFDGAPIPLSGKIAPDLSRSGLGLEFKRQDAERYRI